jgi:hypothetical protein
MYQKKFCHVLKFNQIQNSNDHGCKKRLIKIKYDENIKSDHTMSLIKKAGLIDKIDKSIIVEDNYIIKKIVGYGSTCTVYKAHYY